MEESKELESLLKVEGLFTPSEDIISRSYIKDRKDLDEKLIKNMEQGVYEVDQLNPHIVHFENMEIILLK